MSEPGSRRITLQKTIRQAMLGLLALMMAGYPFVVYLGLERLPLQLMSGILLTLFILRVILLGKTGLQFMKRLTLPIALCGAVLTATSLFLNNGQALLIYPVLVNITCFAVFSWSLVRPPSMIECFARLTEDNFPDAAVRYTRKVTMIWCIFFMMNGCISLYTVILGDPGLWTLYNGLLSYILMGILLGTEWLYRKWILNV